jgi:hypothetical protein
MEWKKSLGKTGVREEIIWDGILGLRGMKTGESEERKRMEEDGRGGGKRRGTTGRGGKGKVKEKGE